MSNKKRMAGDYTISRSFCIGKGEIVMGENPNAPAEERYMVANYETNGVLERYSEALVSDDYAEIVKIYTERIAEQADFVMKEKEKITVDKTPLSASDCEAVGYDKAIKGKVIVIKAEVFKPEYQMSVNQLQLCTGGFGSQANARGSACFCTNLYNGKESRFERRDVLGIIEKDKLPEWAKKALAKVERQLNEKRREER